MLLRSSAVILLFAFFVNPALTQTKTAPKSKAPIAQQAEKSPGELVERVGATGFVQIHAESFRSLTPKQKELAYWLTQAAIAIDPIIYEQQSAFGVRQKRLLEEVVSHPQGIDPAVMNNITTFAKLFWANRGNHNETTAQK